MIQPQYSYGRCPRCLKLLKRKRPADLAVCDCENPPVEVKLTPGFTIELPKEVFDELPAGAKEAGVSVDEFALEVFRTKGLRGLKRGELK